MDWPIPCWRQGGRKGQPELERGNLGILYQNARDGILYQNASRLPVANQDFLVFWMVDICREGCSQRSAPQKRHTACLRRCTRCTPRKLSGWDGGGDKSQPSPGGDCAYQAPGHLGCSDLGRAQNAGPTKSVPLWSTQEPEPEWLRPGECIQPRASITQFPVEKSRA